MTEPTLETLTRAERKKIKRQQYQEVRSKERAKGNRNRNVKRVIWLLLALSITAGSIWWISEQENTQTGTRWTRGKVHWHATIAITTCGQTRSLDNIGSTTNHVGNTLLHTHGDNLYHLEGQPLYTKDTTLGEFFNAIGVPFSDTKIFEYANGDFCPSDTIGVLRVTVNGERIGDPTEYTPNDKDVINITFDKP